MSVTPTETATNAADTVSNSITPDPKKKKSDIAPKEAKPKAEAKKKEKANGKSEQAWSAPQALVSYDESNNYVQLGNSVKDLLATLPKLSETELTGLFRQTVDAERAMFVVRGAVAHELVKRASADGAKFDKSKGGGIDTLINEIAKDVGVDGKTLYADYKVFEEFGGLLAEQLTTAPETIMPREYYVLAMKTSRQAQELPSTVLSYFQEQRESTGGYFTDHARRDAKLFNDGRTVEQVKELDAEFRTEKVAEKAKNGHKTPTPKTTSVELLMTPQNVVWYRAIIKKYSNFNEWFVRKCSEEFGAPEENTEV